MEPEERVRRAKKTPEEIEENDFVILEFQRKIPRANYYERPVLEKRLARLRAKQAELEARLKFLQQTK